MSIAYRAMMFAREAHKTQVRKKVRAELDSAAIESEAARQMKLCSGCATEKPFSNFNRSSRASHGLHNHCRDCQKLTRKLHYEANREQHLEYARLQRKDPAKKEAWKQKLATDHDLRSRLLEYNRNRRRNDRCRKMANEAKRRNEQAFPSAKIARTLRARTRKVLVGINKAAATIDLLGCTIEDFRLHLESQFEAGMTWDNYGYHGWHIDHLRPCASFDLTDSAQQYECFNYKNMRPSWRFDNQSKGEKIVDVLKHADPRLLQLARAQSETM
jgi:hypothetical protein